MFSAPIFYESQTRVGIYIDLSSTGENGAVWGAWMNMPSLYMMLCFLNERYVVCMEFCS